MVLIMADISAIGPKELTSKQTSSICGSCRRPFVDEVAVAFFNFIGGGSFFFSISAYNESKMIFWQQE